MFFLKNVVKRVKYLQVVVGMALLEEIWSEVSAVS
jgi:hypothetical protein